ncbi:MAG: hypothetical protein FWE03_06545 [Firmicutes bacterium]|nr:hypothetical protein [Bacillota bacterium]
MSQTKKLTYTAIATSIAVISLAISVSLSIQLIPILLAALCFYIAFECSIIHGFLSIAATLTLTFFIAGGLIAVFIFAAFLAAPYSILAFSIKKITYSAKKTILIRLGIIIVFFNIMFALIVFAMQSFMGDFLFGISLEHIFNLLDGIIIGYIVLAILGTLLMIFYDISFIVIIKTLNKHLRFLNDQKKD